MAEFLLELFCEEIPARLQLEASKRLRETIVAGLKERGLDVSLSADYVTPRRLIVHLEGLASETPDLAEEKRGPKIDAPVQAIEGFLKNAGVSRADCEERDTGKGVFLFATIRQKGVKTRDLLAAFLPEVIEKFSWPKSQRWGEGNLRWIRPLQRILCLFDGAVVPFTVGGLTAGQETSGHRFHAPDVFEVTGFRYYYTKLLKARVQIDPQKRQQLIDDTAHTLALTHSLIYQRDAGLLEEVAGLVEWPVPMIGSFSPDFLAVPEEVLILTMKQDQKYFALKDSITGKLAPKFIFVAALEPKEEGRAVVKGNERVVAARLADARFFWEQDLKASLESRLPRLETVVFHKELGTLGQRAARMEQLSQKLAPYVPEADGAAVQSASHLLKADLVSAMVYEFPEVQGVMGRYYALAEGMPARVADAIRDHYSPLGPNDSCPSAPVSIVVALTEKLDTLAGFFAIGELPTGSKDPYALRRAALGVIRLVTENALRLPLQTAFDLALDGYGARFDGPTKQEARAHLLKFSAERLKVICRDKGISHDMIDAVFAKGDDDLVRILARVTALQSFLKGEAGANLLAAYRRAVNILKAEDKKEALPLDLTVRPDLLVEAPEQTLYQALSNAGSSLDQALKREDFEGLMALLAPLRAPLDDFFAQVTVNSEDPMLRLNRLGLLKAICTAMEIVADFSLVENSMN